MTTLIVTTILKVPQNSLMVISYLLDTSALIAFIETPEGDNQKTNVLQLARVFAFYVYLNFTTIIIAPDGIIDGEYIIGRNRNQMGMTLLCALTTNIIAYKQQNINTLKLLLLMILCISSVIIVDSMTSSVCLTILCLCVCIPTKFIKRLVSIIYFFIYLIFQTMVVFLQHDTSSNKIISAFIENFLHRELTFSERMSVWEYITEYIQQSPVTGWGFQTGEWFDERISVLSAHNFILQILIYGGYILLASIVIYVFTVLFHSIKNKSSLAIDIRITICSMLLMLVMENYSLTLILYMFTLMYDIDMFTSEQSKFPIKNNKII